jgi:type I restriction-modification system DNA methylase subunit
MELSPKVGRMCAMNLYLHGIGGEKVVINTGHDSLAAAYYSSMRKATLRKKIRS